MVRNDLSVGELHNQPAFNSIQKPELIMAVKKVVTAFA